MMENTAKWAIRYNGKEISSDNYGDAMYDRGFSFSEDEKDAIMAIHDEIKNAWESVMYDGVNWEDITPQSIRNALQAWIQEGEVNAEILNAIEILQTH